MTLSFMGINADLFALGNPSTFADSVRKLNGRYNVLINDPKRAAEFAQALPGEIIQRDYPADWWIDAEKRTPPRDVINIWKSHPQHPKVLRSYLNEPNIANHERDVLDPVRRDKERKRIDAFVSDGVELLRMATGEGIRVVFGNLWAGTPHQYWLQSGAFDPLIIELSGSQHKLGLHEGAPFMIAGRAAVGLRYEDMKDPAKVRRSQWGNPEDFPLSKLPNGEYPHYWMIGRCIWWGIRALEIGVKPPRIVITELTAAINEQEGALDLYRVLNDGHNPRDLDGFPSLIPQYLRYFGDEFATKEKGKAIAPARVINEQAAWYAAFVPENVEGACYFAHNYG